MNYITILCVRSNFFSFRSFDSEIKRQYIFRIRFKVQRNSITIQSSSIVVNQYPQSNRNDFSYLGTPCSLVSYPQYVSICIPSPEIIIKFRSYTVKQYRDSPIRFTRQIKVPACVDDDIKNKKTKDQALKYPAQLRTLAKITPHKTSTVTSCLRIFFSFFETFGKAGGMLGSISCWQFFALWAVTSPSFRFFLLVFMRSGNFSKSSQPGRVLGSKPSWPFFALWAVTSSFFGVFLIVFMRC